MNAQKLLDLLNAHRSCGSFTKQDYDYFDRKIKELDFDINKEMDIDALEIRITNLIRRQSYENSKTIS